MFLNQFLESAAEQCKIFESHFAKRRSEIERFIADELAKREAAKPEPAAEAEVPECEVEWAAVRIGKDTVPCAYFADMGDAIQWADQKFPEIESSCTTEPLASESHIARRVAEAVAEKDKRIAELERENRDYSDLVVNLNRNADTLEAERDRFIQQLAAMTADRDVAVHNYEIAQTEAERLKAEIAELHEPPPSLNTPKSPGFVRAINENVLLSDEITKLRGENARLISEIIGNLKVIPGAIRIREGGAEEDVAKSLAVSVAKLVDENARLTRPVEDERSFFASDANNDVSEVVGVLRHRAERNAREAAEAERDAAAAKRQAEIVAMLRTESRQWTEDAEGKANRGDFHNAVNSNHRAAALSDMADELENDAIEADAAKGEG